MAKEVNSIVCITQYKYMETLRIIEIVLTVLYHQYFQLSPDGTSSTAQSQGNRCVNFAWQLSWLRIPAFLNNLGEVGAAQINSFLLS